MRKQFYGNFTSWEEKNCNFERNHLKVTNLALFVLEELHKKLILTLMILDDIFFAQ